MLVFKILKNGSWYLVIYTIFARCLDSLAWRPRSSIFHNTIVGACVQFLGGYHKLFCRTERASALSAWQKKFYSLRALCERNAWLIPARKKLEARRRKFTKVSNVQPHVCLEMFNCLTKRCYGMEMSQQERATSLGDSEIWASSFWTFKFQLILETFMDTNLSGKTILELRYSTPLF